MLPLYKSKTRQSKTNKTYKIAKKKSGSLDQTIIFLRHVRKTSTYLVASLIRA